MKKSMEKHLSQSPAQTQQLAKVLAKRITKFKKGKGAVVLGLLGDLGGGKTTFLQGFAKGLGIKERVLSPTFVLMKKFPFNGRCFIHIDCYRIRKPKELLGLGFKDLITDPKNIVAVEWADRIKKIMPKNALLIRFEFINKETRKIVIESKNGK